MSQLERPWKCPGDIKLNTFQSCAFSNAKKNIKCKSSFANQSLFKQHHVISGRHTRADIHPIRKPIKIRKLCKIIAYFLVFILANFTSISKRELKPKITKRVTLCNDEKTETCLVNTNG